ncbi:hypothetical protein ABZX29_38305, partial [Streptomyces zhihengii]
MAGAGAGRVAAGCGSAGVDPAREVVLLPEVDGAGTGGVGVAGDGTPGATGATGAGTEAWPGAGDGPGDGTSGAVGRAGG